MMTKGRVLSVGYAHGIYDCVIIQYQTKECVAFAAVAEQLSVKEGDLVWILHDDKLFYKGFSAVAVLLA